MGKGTPVSSPDDWRQCHRRFDGWAVSSAYGPAGHEDSVWFAGALDALASVAGPLPGVVVGDLNWKAGYSDIAEAPWAVADTPPTTAALTSPSRLVGLDCSAEVVDSAPLPAVPHHFGVVYDVDLPPPQPAQALRLKRSARYEWVRAPSRDEAALLAAAADEWGAPSPGSSSSRPSDWATEALARWHRRAEAAVKTAAALGVATVTRAAERAKGVSTETRPVAPSGPSRLEATIRERRLLRLHRLVVAAGRASPTGTASPLPPLVSRKWATACQDGLVQGFPPTLGEAAQALSRALVVEAKVAQERALKTWRSQFRNWGARTAAAAARTMREPAPAPVFSAEDMRREWEPWWVPDRSGPPLDWVAVAREWGVPEVPADPAWRPPSFEAFQRALQDSHGAAGLDGWEVAELQGLSEHCPDLIRELWAILAATVEGGAGPWPDERLRAFGALRVVGIPKRGSDDARPIAIGPVWMRAWGRCLIDALPPAPAEAFGERGAVASVADWAAAPGNAGAEVDLSRAYDSVDHGVAGAALCYQGTPPPVVAALEAVWRAPRYCSVAGDLADALNPTRGLPPGDPPSGRVLSVVLLPWHNAVRSVPRTRGWSYVDDRSLKAAAAVDRDRALAITAEVDRRLGFSENLGKRQVWSGTQSAEHLGVRAAVGDAAVWPQLPEPRDGWDPIRSQLRRLRTVPGGQRIRELAALMCVAPKHRWSAPFCAIPPPDLIALTLRSVVRTRCTWWCARRWYAERVSLHPIFGTACAVLKAARGVPASRLLSVALSEHAGVFGLRPVSTGPLPEGTWLLPAPGLDPRAAAAVAAAAADDSREARTRTPRSRPRPPRGAFDASSDRGQHALRECARAVLLRARGPPGPPRHDEDGIGEIDLAAQSAQPWAQFRRSLGRFDAILLSVWRGGAVCTPTRRRGPAAPGGACVCPFGCGHAQASARHFWAECPRFAGRRYELGRQLRVAPAWWGAQPRVTSKSGWITKAAGGSVRRRADLQVMACRLGIDIMQALAGLSRAGRAGGWAFGDAVSSPSASRDPPPRPSLPPPANGGVAGGDDDDDLPPPPSGGGGG